MSWRRHLAKIRALFHRRKPVDDLEEEIRAHLAMEEQENIEAGMPPEEAHYAALRRFGNVTQAQERSREMWGWRWVETLLQDLRYGLRQLRRNPGFTAVAILTLALGIGANTAIFTLIDAVALRTLPVHDSGQLVLLRWTAHRQPKAPVRYSYSGCPGGTSEGTSANSAGCSFSYPMFDQIQQAQTGLAGVFAFTGTYPVDTSFRGRVGSAYVQFVSGSFFPVLGERPLIGRLLDPGDDIVDAVPVLVLSHAYWQSHFGGDPSVVGKALALNGAPFTIAGVSPSGFFGLDPGTRVDFWIPLSCQPSVIPYFPKKSDAAGLWLDIGGRLKPNVPPSSARAAVDLIFARGTTNGPGAIFKPADAPRVDLLNTSRGLATLRHRFSHPLFLLMAAVGIILLIACANLASMTLARTANRQREIAVRLAMGAGRWRVARQLFTESALLAGGAGAAGILLAYWGASSLASFFSSNSYTHLQIDTRPDLAVLCFTLAISVLTAILFGFAPGVFASRLNLIPALKEARGGPAGPGYDSGRRSRFVNTLVVAQVALSILVLASAGLLVRTLVDLKTMNVGFGKNNLLLFSVDTTLSGTKGPQLQALSRNLQEQFASLPGVTSVSYSMTSLLSGGAMTWTDAPLRGAQGVQKATIEELPVGPKFFDTMRIPMLAGHTFGPADFRSQVKPRRVIVNQTLARRYFGSEDPLGRRLLMNAKGADWEIVGIVQDAKYGNLRAPIGPTVYLPFRPSMGEPTFELRTERDPEALTSLVRSAAEKVNKGILLSNVTTQTEQINKNLYQERLFASLSSAFALLALLLVAVGLYGLLAYQMARRTHEIGIRMALGAEKRDVLKMVIGQGLKLALIGVAIGIAGALALTRFLTSLLYGVKPTDPITFAAVSLILIAVALLACYIPARRAAKVDPMVALRDE